MPWVQLDGLDQTTQAAFKGIAVDWANASDRYARDYDAHTAQQGPTPFQIPGAAQWALLPVWSMMLKPCPCAKSAWP